MPKKLFDKLFYALTKKTKTIQLQRLFDETKDVIIYGAGNAGKDIFRVLRANGILVRCFLDQKAKPRDQWEGVPVMQPGDGKISNRDRENASIVIGIFNAFVDIPPIVNHLKLLDYSHVINFLDFYDHFSSELGDRYWLTDKSFYSGVKSHIEAGYGVWADDISRNLYASILKFRFTNDYRVLPTPDCENQYFPADISQWKNPLRFIDCGAYDGDTLKYLLKTKYLLEAFAGFEPDQANFTKLANFCRKEKKDLPEAVSLFPCGVSHSTKQWRFSSGQGSGSHTSATGEDLIQCVSLDEALPNFRPNLIKMDIEGAEYDTLLGARNLIEEYHPGLAVCVYHRPEHLWQIPLYMKESLGEGKLYLRLHGYSAFDIVAYHVPTEKTV